MAITQILPYDYFHQWRSKTNEIANLLGDLDTINVSAIDRESMVDAINKVISNIGVLSTLNTTAKDSIVNSINEVADLLGNTALTTTATSITDAINELDADIGNKSTLTTTNKTSAVNAINELDAEHGTLSSLQTSNKSTFVASINELFDKIGPLATLNTTNKDNLVDALSEVQTELGDITTLTTTDQTSAVNAINELDNNIGNLTSLNTTNKTSAVNAINEVLNDLLIGNAVFTIGSENTDVINVSVQLKDLTGNNIAIVAGVQIYLSDNSNGSSLSASSPSGGIAIGTNGILLPIITDKYATVISTSSGVFDINITEITAKTFYVVVLLPLGKLVISSAVTFA